MLFRKLRWLFRQIRAHRKTVFDIGEQVKLVRNLHLLKDILRLATLFSGEDGVSFYVPG